MHRDHEEQLRIPGILQDHEEERPGIRQGQGEISRGTQLSPNSHLQQHHHLHEQLQDHHPKKSGLKFKRLTPRSQRQEYRRRNLYARPAAAAAAASRNLFAERKPSAEELEDFFSGLEEKIEVRNFIDRYNYDVVHDVPLPGRYEWIKVQE